MRRVRAFPSAASRARSSITADSQEDLQRALDVCQSFANESSFEYSMEKSQVVIFGGDYSFNAPAFTLMGQTMAATF